MKKCIIFIGIVFIGAISLAQENMISQNGNIGIGTVDPKEKLEVNGKTIFNYLVTMEENLNVKGDLKVRNKFTSNGNAVFNGVLTTTYPEIRFQNLLNPTISDFAKSKLLIIDSVSGRIMKSSIPLLTAEIYKPIVCPQTVSGEPLSPIWSNLPGILYTAQGFCHSKTKVGIGTNNPSARLQIHLTSSAISNALKVTAFHPYADGTYKVFNLSRKGEMLLTAHTKYVKTPFLIKTLEGKKLFKIDNTGFVRARRVRVDAEEWPDYVFQSDYKLRSLEETEDFINKNGHLPNVPNAEIIKKEGQDLGQMNKLLMEKVEELTLHLIEQNKRINNLEKKLNRKR